MSVRCLTWAWSRSLGTGPKDKRPGEKLLLTAIADQASDEGIGWSGCTPTKLRKMTELSSSSFYRHRDYLVQKGLLYVVERYRPDGVKTDSWFILTIDLKAAYEQFETMVRDGAIDANPLNPDGTLNPPIRPTMGQIRPMVGHQIRPTMGHISPMVGEDRPTMGHHPSHGGTDPSRVENGPLDPSLPSLSPATAERAPTDVEIVCDHLADRIAERNPGGRPASSSESWRSEARLLLAEDGRTVEQVTAVIDWCQADSFNRRAVRTPRALRARFGELADRAGVRLVGRGHGPGVPSPGHCCAAAGSPPTEAEASWSRIAEQLQQELGESTYEIWIAPAHPHHDADGSLILAVPAELRAWVAERFGSLIDRVAGRHVPVTACEEERP